MLFDPCTLKGRTLKNRVVFPPAVCFGWSDHGELTEGHFKHYGNVALGGAGLIIMEAGCVAADALLIPSQIGIWSDEFIGGYARIAEVCHAQNVPVLAQIHHAGHKAVNGTPLVPSAVSGAKELEHDEIVSIRQKFIEAALRIKKAGLDGVELHGAHGYLLSYFLSSATNMREDEYGGSVENRARLVVEIMEGIRAECGPDFIIGIRYGLNPVLEDGIAYAKLFEKAGCDILHISTGAKDSDQIPVPPEHEGWASPVYTAVEVKKQVSIPVIASNSVGTLERGKELVDGGLVDFAAYCRNILADYDWVKKAEAGENPKGCFHCKRCTWFDCALEKCPARRRAA